jgi:hypothetical protein
VEGVRGEFECGWMLHVVFGGLLSVWDVCVMVRGEFECAWMLHVVFRGLLSVWDVCVMVRSK